ncbi:MAG: blue (type 1) copper domain protein [Solirubrobacterales bacterium]|jgi:plastocyanin|nr:blue (type 1) copper domain protein [Solirubrobacterales bacterium]
MGLGATCGCDGRRPLCDCSAARAAQQPTREPAGEGSRCAGVLLVEVQSRAADALASSTATDEATTKGVFEIVRLRRRSLLALVMALGAAVVVLPAVAGSETGPTVKAEDAGVYGEAHRWSPEQTRIAPAEAVAFANGSTTIPHGIVWTSSVAPVCEASVPVGSGNFKTNWSGSCTFAQSGEYAFYCSYHGPIMHGTVIVASTGTTTTTTSTQPTTPGAATGSPPLSGSGPSTAPAGAPASPLLGSAATAVKLASSQRGSQVRGSVTVSQAGAGGRLEVDLLAKSSSLAVAGHSKRSRVGRIVRSALQPGSVRFTVILNARAKHALRGHRRLALQVQIRLTPAHGSAVTVTRSVLLHA